MRDGKGTGVDNGIGAGGEALEENDEGGDGCGDRGEGSPAVGAEHGQVDAAGAGGSGWCDSRERGEDVEVVGRGIVVFKVEGGGEERVVCQAEGEGEAGAGRVGRVGRRGVGQGVGG